MPGSCAWSVGNRGRNRNGSVTFKPKLEDIHMNIEAILTEKLGDLSRKLHTARSRNDQTVTDLKPWVREALVRVNKGLTGLQMAIVNASVRNLI